MSMIEIDPHLFIKCRLCLEESGIYQIVPAIRDQISFCFGINVEPFDGLPQLICKKCQLVLGEYSKTKQNFIQKQEDLKKRKPENNVTTTDSDLNKKHGAAKYKHENNDKVKTYSKIKRKRLLTSSSEESNDSNSKKHAADSDIRNTTNEVENTDWKANYQKTFTCTLCNTTCSTRKAINSHQVIHKALKFKHVDIFNKYCIVKMPKIDDKPNLTGTIDHVVYSKKKIIAKSTADYYFAYKYEDSLDDENLKREEHGNEDEYTDSSFKSNKKVRRRRVRQLTSRSSTETVVLENNAYGSKTDNDCISIDDSDSSDDKDEPNQKRKASKKIDHIDTAEATNMISKLITMSHNKYAKRHEVLDKSTLQQLNRKIVSIGRQIINKRGFNTNRLMKYMEHLNLNIIWLARSPLSVTNNSNYFKIIPRTRYSNEKSVNDFEGYKKKYDKRNVQNRETEDKLDQELAEEESEAEINEGKVDLVRRAGMAQMSKVNQDVNVSTIEQSEVDPVLLNANPVANPKQLKKLQSEAKKTKIASNSMPTLEVNPEELSSEVMTDHEYNMPVITFTRSLANPNTNENSNNDNTESCNAISDNENSKPEPPKTAPRIKVKSVSELMSKETLSRMNDPAPVLSPIQQLNGGAQYAVTPLQRNSVSSTESASDEYVILDTVELPNTKTNSPFSYFRTLLQVHNFSLLDTDAPLTPDFHSLIRFKVRYNQENKEPQETVVLCLSLFCLNNIFCIKVRDRFDQININLSQISANWQWEILKIYKGDVVPKVLMNAEKTGPEVFRNTNRFICLLKSINYVPK